jgi:hypothetical protein
VNKKLQPRELNKTFHPLPPLKQRNFKSPVGNSDSATPTMNCASPTLNKKVNHATTTKRFPCRRSDKQLRNPHRQLRKRKSNKKLRKPDVSQNK